MIAEELDLPEIIRRLERAKAPDRDLDLLIGKLWPEPRPFDLSLKQNRGMKPTVYRFTESMDHARALMLQFNPDDAYLLEGPDAGDQFRCAILGYVDAYAVSEPIAMCLAVLYVLRRLAQ